MLFILKTPLLFIDLKIISQHVIVLCIDIFFHEYLQIASVANESTICKTVSISVFKTRAFTNSIRFITIASMCLYYLVNLIHLHDFDMFLAQIGVMLPYDHED